MNEMKNFINVSKLIKPREKPSTNRGHLKLLEKVKI